MYPRTNICSPVLSRGCTHEVIKQIADSQAADLGAFNDSFYFRAQWLIE